MAEKHCPNCGSTSLIKVDSRTKLKWKCTVCKYITSTPVEE